MTEGSPSTRTVLLCWPGPVPRSLCSGLAVSNTDFPSSRSHAGLGQGSWTSAETGHPAGHSVAPRPLQPGSACCWSRAAPCALLGTSTGSQSHPQPGLGLLLRAEQPPVLPRCLPSFPAQRPYTAAFARWGGLAAFPPNSALQSLPGCCETPVGGEGSAGQAGQRSLCCGAAGAVLLRAAQGAGFTLACGPPAWLAAGPAPACSLPQDLTAPAAGAGRRELQGDIRPYFLPIQFETS